MVRPCSLFNFWKVRQDDFAGFCVKVAGRLVGQNERRIIDQGAGDGHALDLAARQLVGLVHKMRFVQAGRFQRSRARIPALFFFDACVDQGQRDIAQNGRPRQQIERLENKADFVAADNRPVRRRSTSRRLCRPANTVRMSAYPRQPRICIKRGFAGAGWSHDGHEFAVFDFEADALQGLIASAVVHDMFLLCFVRRS